MQPNNCCRVSSIESKSSHPVAAVLVDYGRSQGVEPKQDNVEDFQNFPGEGVFGKINGRNIYIGNQKLGQRANCTIGKQLLLVLFLTTSVVKHFYYFWWNFGFIQSDVLFPLEPNVSFKYC